MDIEIGRASTEPELKAGFALIRALAVHENAEEKLKITEADFVAHASADPPLFHVAIARLKEDIVGAATYYQRFHIWNGTYIFELDDLFVTPKARGLSIGTGLLQFIGDKAKAENVPVKWQVLAENHAAIALYKRMGADFSTSGICWWRPENIG